MATIIPHPAIRPRSLVNVLADIREAKRDLDDALPTSSAAKRTLMTVRTKRRLG
jgi:hypothetical protein